MVGVKWDVLEIDAALGVLSLLGFVSLSFCSVEFDDFLVFWMIDARTCL